MQNKTVNSVTLCGIVQIEPIIRYFSEDNVKAYFSLLTFDEYKSTTESKLIPEYHHIVAWKKLAIQIENEIKKNQFIKVIGRLKTSNYEKEGQTKTSVQIVISEFEIIQDSQKDQKIPNYPPANDQQKLDQLSKDLFSESDEDDLPF